MTSTAPVPPGATRPMAVRRLLPAAVALPGLILAGVGLTHPAELTPDTAHHWWTMHVVLLPVFPLLAVVVGVLLRSEHGVLAWAARVAAYVYAVFYTALDVLAGIAAGLAMDTEPAGPAVGRLLELGSQLATPGKWAYLTAVVLTGAVLVRRSGNRALPGALISVSAAVPFMTDHIYWPIGVLAQLGIALGAVLLALVPATEEGLAHA